MPKPSLTILCWTILNRCDLIPVRGRIAVKKYSPLMMSLAELVVRGEASPTEKARDGLTNLNEHLEIGYQQTQWYDENGKIN